MMGKGWLVACAAALALAAGSSLAAGSAPGAKEGRQGQRHARVRGGERMPLAGSRLDDVQLSAMRPGYRNLRPKARGNAE